MLRMMCGMLCVAFASLGVSKVASLAMKVAPWLGPLSSRLRPIFRFLTTGNTSLIFSLSFAGKLCYAKNRKKPQPRKPWILNDFNI